MCSECPFWSCALWSPSGTLMREAGLDCREPAASRGQPGVGIGTRSVGLLLHPGAETHGTCLVRKGTLSSRTGYKTL